MWGLSDSAYKKYVDLWGFNLVWDYSLINKNGGQGDLVIAFTIIRNHFFEYFKPYHLRNNFYIGCIWYKKYCVPQLRQKHLKIYSGLWFAGEILAIACKNCFGFLRIYNLFFLFSFFIFNTCLRSDITTATIVYQIPWPRNVSRACTTQCKPVMVKEVYSSL